MDTIEILGKKYPYFVSANLSQTYMYESNKLNEEGRPPIDPEYIGLTLLMFRQAIRSGYKKQGFWGKIFAGVLTPKVKPFVESVDKDKALEMTAILFGISKEDLIKTAQTVKKKPIAKRLQNGSKKPKK